MTKIMKQSKTKTLRGKSARTLCITPRKRSGGEKSWADKAGLESHRFWTPVQPLCHPQDVALWSRWHLAPAIISTFQEAAPTHPLQENFLEVPHTSSWFSLSGTEVGSHYQQQRRLGSVVFYSWWQCARLKAKILLPWRKESMNDGLVNDILCWKEEVQPRYSDLKCPWTENG